ncbi:MAG: hypothetical protein WBA93_18950 [Microcoleaceae cyanobacterium]
MSKTLLIPIHVDALCLNKQQQVLRAMADYTLLPYIYKNYTYGSGQKNLSETALAPLFNQEFTLKAGIHLHWSLPDALTDGEHTINGTTFPKVPNRWLIVRKGGNQGAKTWIVENDYLYPVLEPGDNSPPPDAINILIQPPHLATVDPNDPNTYQYPRYRYMGKCWELSEWQADTQNKEYAEELTAIGNQATVAVFDEVKATFAAFYPNCHSVFGFHDPDYVTDTPPNGLQYDAIGWYSDLEDDCLTQFLAENCDQTTEELLEALQEQFYWTIKGGGELPDRTLYHSRITFTGQGGSLQNFETPKVAVANSDSEAISAYLAHEFNGDTNDEGKSIRKNVQDTLEALQLSERLESKKVDLDAKFREGRHERGFGTQNERFLWLLMPQSAQNETTKDLTLPSQLAQLLNELNTLQQTYNQAWLDIGSLRDRLYSQWCYFVKQDPNFYGTVNETSLIPLRTAIAQTGELEFSEDRVIAKTLPFGVVSCLNDYFSYYVDTIQTATTGNFNNWADIQAEFSNCGVTISNSPTVTSIIDNESWEISDNGQTYPVKVEEGIFTIYVPPSSSQVAFDIVNKLNELSQALTTHNASSATQYQLNPFPTESYWRGNDPVILLAGESTKSPLRFGQDGRLRDDELLECSPLDCEIATIVQNIDSLLSQIDSLQPTEGEDSINFISWSQQPWNPFAFHWSVLNYPCRDMVSGEVQDYNPNQILDNYELQHNAIDLKLKEGQESSFVPNVNTYTGFSILTPSVGSELTLRLTTYLNEQLLPSYYFINEIPETDQTPDYLDTHLVEIKDWYQHQNELDTPEKQAADPMFVALWSYEQMQTLDCQAQMLGGFNDTLLLGQPTLQLQVDYPLSTDPVAKLFTEQVRWSLGDRLQHKILSGDIFNPIRSGGFSVNKLWLIDSFGQHQEVVSDRHSTTMVTTYQMTPANPDTVDYQAILPPRLAQPARLNFHWLSADTLQEVEYTKNPVKSPVCGWIIPNNLDSSLAIYNHQGRTLGSIDLGGNWRNAPGVQLSRDGNGYPLLENHHLQKLVHYLLRQGVSFQQQFLSTVDNALETIDPESFAQHSSLALLVGRPIAIVRATFSLEVKGLPACNPTVAVNSGDEFPSYGFTGVKIPIRLGDYQQLNDGLVGYWKETPNGTEGDYDYEDDIFYATQSRLVEDNNITTDAEGINHFLQTVDAPPQGVTMLIDPRGLIHASCGVLPNQELRLPSEHFNQALQTMEVNFLSTPILSNLGELAMPLSQEANAVWSWVSLIQSETNIEEWTEKIGIKPINTRATFAKPQQVSEGWLQLSRADITEQS